MISPESRRHLVLLAIGLLLLLGPVLFIALTLGALALFGDLALGRVTPIEFLELYIIDLLLFVGLAYGIYRLTLWIVAPQTPASPDSLEGRDADGSRDDESADPEDP